MTHVFESDLKLVVDSLVTIMKHNTELCETTCYPHNEKLPTSFFIGVLSSVLFSLTTTE